MKKIESYDQCNLLIKNFRKAGGKIVTNFFFLPKELKDLIEQKEVRYQQNDGALIFSVEENDFSHIFYFVRDDLVPDVEKTDKEMILDLVARQGKNSKELKSEKERWQTVGFRVYKSYIRMKYGIDNPFFAGIDFGLKKGCDFSNARQGDIDAVLDLWKMNLDRYSTPLPYFEDMKRIIESGHVYVVRQRGSVVGAVYMNTASKSCVLQHLAVAPECRRQGLGTALMNYALKGMAQEGIETCYLWVDIHNVPAYESYRKYGFEEDGLRSEQLRCSVDKE